MRALRTAAAVVAAASLALGLAPAALATQPTADAVSTAQAMVAKYTVNPTTIGAYDPIAKPIPKNKRIITFTSPVHEADVLARYTVQAAKLLGWKVEVLPIGATLKEQRKALDLAIAKKPDGIAVSGMESTLHGDQFVKAEKAGIAIVCSACVKEKVGALKHVYVSGREHLDLLGRLVAAYAVANTGGKANVQMFGLSAFPILNRYDHAFQMNLLRMCPDCEVAHSELNLAGIGQQAVDAVKANPRVSFISYSLGGFANGVPAALTAAGFAPGTAPLIGGITADATAIQSLRDGTTNVWTGYSLPIAGYSVIDAFARHWAKVPLEMEDVPVQLLTRDNVDTAVFTAEGDYLGVKGFQAQFKKVWGIK